MSELPKGWVAVKAEGICEKVQSGSTPRNNPFTEHGDIPYLKVYNIVNQKIAFDYKKQFISNEIHQEKLSRSKVLPNDVLMNIVGPPLGKVAIVGNEFPEWNINQAITLFRPKQDFLSHRFLYYFLNEGSAVKSVHGDLKGSVGQVNISLSQCRNFDVPVPPLTEQKRIVEKLDEVLAQVDTIKARLDGIPDLLKRFRQSVLASAVSGKLTQEWRTKNSGFERSSDLLKRWLSERKNNFHKEQERLIEDGRIKRARKYKEPVKPNLEKSPELFPETWTTVSVSQFAECLDSMRIPVKKEDRASARGLYPYFGANGLVDKVDEYIFDDELVLVTEDETFYGRTKPIAYRSSGKCWVNNHAHVLRASTKAANDYLCYALMYKNVEPWLSGSTGRAKLTQAALNEIPLGLPPEGELNQIVGLVGQFLSFADTIEAQVKKAQARVDNLTQSILAKAFRGELVEQGPNDEPADKLLERIAEARKEAEALAKAAKKAEAAKKRAAKSA
ncbi:restriction endonuclease subunit S [Vibrio splendidus]